MGEQTRYHTLVCVSTAQEIINALPALELGVGRVLALVTDKAKKEGWPDNLAAGLRGVEVEQIPLGPDQEDSPHEIKQLILEALQERRLARGVALGWGGGQKPHSAGLWLAFEALYEAQPEGIIIIYIDANRNEKQVWTHPHKRAVRSKLQDDAEQDPASPFSALSSPHPSVSLEDEFEALGNFIGGKAGQHAKEAAALLRMATAAKEPVLSPSAPPSPHPTAAMPTSVRPAASSGPLGRLARLDIDAFLALSGLEQTPKSLGKADGAPCVSLWPESAAVALPSWSIQAVELFGASQEFRRICFELSSERSNPSRRASVDELEAQFEELPFKDFGNIFKEAIQAMSVPLNFQKLDRQSKNWFETQFPPRVRKVLLEQAKNKSKNKMEAMVELPSEPKALSWLKECNKHVVGFLDLNTCLAPHTLLFSRFFEVLLAERVRRWAVSRAAQGKAPRQILLNLECKQRAGRDVTAELDVVILTQAGQLVSLDAKSFAVDKTTQHAQERRFQAMGGSFGKRFVCWPMFAADCGKPDRRTPEDSWGYQSWYPKELVEQIKYWRADLEEYPKEALKLIPYDETSKLEDMLDRETGVASPPKRGS